MTDAITIVQIGPIGVAILILAFFKVIELLFWFGKWSYKIEQAIEELYQRRQERKTDSLSKEK